MNDAVITQSFNAIIDYFKSILSLNFIKFPMIHYKIRQRSSFTIFHHYLIKSFIFLCHINLNNVRRSIVNFFEQSDFTQKVLLKPFVCFFYCYLNIFSFMKHSSKKYFCKCSLSYLSLNFYFRLLFYCILHWDLQRSLQTSHHRIISLGL